MEKSLDIGKYSLVSEVHALYYLSVFARWELGQGWGNIKNAGQYS